MEFESIFPRSAQSTTNTQLMQPTVLRLWWPLLGSRCYRSCGESPFLDKSRQGQLHPKRPTAIIQMIYILHEEMLRRNICANHGKITFQLSNFALVCRVSEAAVRAVCGRCYLFPQNARIGRDVADFGSSKVILPWTSPRQSKMM